MHSNTWMKIQLQSGRKKPDKTEQNNGWFREDKANNKNQLPFIMCSRAVIQHTCDMIR